jgi:hypothetical protein
MAAMATPFAHVVRQALERGAGFNITTRPEHPGMRTPKNSKMLRIAALMVVLGAMFFVVFR